MTDKVIIFDTTLRDGEQSPGVALNIQDKLEIARQLEKLRVDVIEAGFPITSPGDFECVTAVSREIRNCTIAALAHADAGGRRCLLGRPQRRRPAAHPHRHLQLGDPPGAPTPQGPRRGAGDGSHPGRARQRLHLRRRVQRDGRQPLRPGLPLPDDGAGHRRRRHNRQHPRYRRLLHARGVRATSSATSSRKCPTSTRPSSPCIATTTSAWPSPTHWPPSAPAPVRSSAASTASASAPATPPWKRS